MPDEPLRICQACRFLPFHFVMFEQGIRQVRWFTVLGKPNKGIHDEKIT
jgi:hypothetical protein